MACPVLVFDKMSSAGPGGKRDLSVDLNAYLEPSEVVESAQVISDKANMLQVSNVILQGTEVIFSLEVLEPAFMETKRIRLLMPFVGNQGSADTYRIIMPIKPYLES